MNKPLTAAQLPTFFLWRDRRGVKHNVSDMETRHLFHTLSMIWNHVMPAEAKTHDYKRYEFSSFYTQEYMGQAIRAIYKELEQRNNLEHYMKDRLEVMHRYLFKEKRIEQK